VTQKLILTAPDIERGKIKHGRVLDTVGLDGYVAGIIKP